jgi:hypothetical protein
MTARLSAIGFGIIVLFQVELAAGPGSPGAADMPGRCRSSCGRRAWSPQRFGSSQGLCCCAEPVT